MSHRTLLKLFVRYASKRVSSNVGKIEWPLIAKRTVYKLKQIVLNSNII